MAQTNSNVNAANTSANEGKPAIFLDFLGRGSASDSPAAKAVVGDVRLRWEESPLASASVGTSSGGVRGPIPTTSDLASERQVGNHLEGVPFYGPRSDFSGPDSSNRFSGCKRSNSDSAFMGSSRDGFPQMRPDSMESSHVTKMLRNAGGERRRWAHDEETYLSAHAIRPSSISYISQPLSGGKADGNVPKWERTIPMSIGPISHHPPRSGHAAPFGYQSLSNRFKDANAGPSVISPTAADEGSRTGIKGSGILSSNDANGGVSERNLLPSSLYGSGIYISERESSSTPSGSHHGLTSSSRQMTIFYGSQAHVFDDVHPNKADMIMALAGSNGGSWSTTYASKSLVRPYSGENHVLSGENDTGVDNSAALPRESNRRLSFMRQTGHGFGTSGDRMSVRPGIHQNSIIMKNEEAPLQAKEHDSKGKHEEAERSHG